MSIFNSTNNPLGLSQQQLQLIGRLATEECRLATAMGTYVFTRSTKPYEQLYDGKDMRLPNTISFQLNKLPACTPAIADQQRTIQAMHLLMAYAKGNSQLFKDIVDWTDTYSSGGTAMLAFSNSGHFAPSICEDTLCTLLAHLYATRYPNTGTGYDSLAETMRKTYATLKDERGKAFTLGSYLTMLKSFATIILGRNDEATTLDFLYYVMDERNRMTHRGEVESQPVEVIMELYVEALFAMLMIVLKMMRAAPAEGAIVAASEPNVEVSTNAVPRPLTLQRANAIFAIRLPAGTHTLTATTDGGQRQLLTADARDGNFMRPDRWLRFNFASAQQAAPAAKSATPPTPQPRRQTTAKTAATASRTTKAAATASSVRTAQKVKASTTPKNRTRTRTKSVDRKKARKSSMAKLLAWLLAVAIVAIIAWWALSMFTGKDKGSTDDSAQADIETVAEGSHSPQEEDTQKATAEENATATTPPKSTAKAQVDVSRMYFREGGTVRMTMGSTTQLQLVVEPEDYNEVLSVSVAKNTDGLDVVSLSPDLTVTPLRRGKVLVQITSGRTKKEAHCFIEVQ